MANPSPILVGLLVLGMATGVVLSARLLTGGAATDGSRVSGTNATSGGNSVASYEKYAADVCQGIQDYVAANQKAFQKAATGSAQSVAERNRAAGERIDTLLRSLGEADPPSDLDGYHSALVDSIKANAETSAEMNTTLSTLGVGSIQLRGEGFFSQRAVQKAEAARAQLQAVADENADCNGWTF